MLMYIPFSVEVPPSWSIKTFADGGVALLEGPLPGASSGAGGAGAAADAMVNTVDLQMSTRQSMSGEAIELLATAESAHGTQFD